MVVSSAKVVCLGVGGWYEVVILWGCGEEVSVLHVYVCERRRVCVKGRRVSLLPPDPPGEWNTPASYLV